MKTQLCVIVALGLLLLAPPASVSAAMKEKNMQEPQTPHGSIRPKGKPSATERLALAKISFQEAFNAAVTAVPGRVTYAELEVEDGNLQYDFEIITAKNRVMDVSIDAGDGKVLDVDEGEDK